MALSKKTAAKLDQGLAALKAAQKAGTAPPPGEVSQAHIAALAGVSEATVANVEKMATARFAAGLLARADDLPPWLARKLSRMLQP